MSRPHRSDWSAIKSEIRRANLQTTNRVIAQRLVSKTKKRTLNSLVTIVSTCRNYHEAPSYSDLDSPERLRSELNNVQNEVLLLTPPRLEVMNENENENFKEAQVLLDLVARQTKVTYEQMVSESVEVRNLEVQLERKKANLQKTKETYTRMLTQLQEFADSGKT